MIMSLSDGSQVVPFMGDMCTILGEGVVTLTKEKKEEGHFALKGSNRTRSKGDENAQFSKACDEGNRIHNTALGVNNTGYDRAFLIKRLEKLASHGRGRKYYSVLHPNTYFEELLWPSDDESHE